MPVLWLFQAVGTAHEITPLHSGIAEYLKLVLVFGIVLVFAIVVLRVWLPRMTGIRRISSGPIRVIARYPLEPRKNLYIVHAAGGYFLVGTSESGVHYLTALDSNALESSLPVEAPPTGLDFAKLIHSFKRPRRDF
jgi:flagellar biogenesis protein FliO